MIQVYPVYNPLTGFVVLQFKSPRGVISLHLPCHLTFGCWEIYCLEGNLFDDIERYRTRGEVLNRIKTLLSEPED